MIEEIGQLDIKVCGYQHCCFTTHLDNDDTNFERGDLDVFAGPGAIVQCNEFLIRDASINYVVRILRLFEPPLPLVDNFIT